MKKIELYVGEDDNERLDHYLAEELNEISRTYIQKLIKDGNVTVDGKYKKPSYLVKEGESILAVVPEAEPLRIKAQNLPIDIVYQDESLAVINKPQGMVVHPAPGNYEGTLVNGLLYHLDNLSSINGVIRPGIVHRLDKDTSGLIVVAKTDIAHRALSNELKDHKIVREYIALLHGRLKEEKGTIDAPIGRDTSNRKKMAVIYKNSKPAITHYQVLKYYDKYTLVRVRLETGRTHQIRVHLSKIGHPVVGDPVYSNGKNEFGIAVQLLHAGRIEFTHPVTGMKLEFKAPCPDLFKEILSKLDRREGYHEDQSIYNGPKSDF